jgi:hypothetical protein
VTVERVIAYIDGYNLYYGLRTAGLLTSRWLHLEGLCRRLLKPNQRLELVRYFTTRVRDDPEAVERQNDYLDALEARGGIEIDYGHFLAQQWSCRACGSSWTKREEKKTDVNIAVRLLEDAYDDRWDVAMLI